MIVFPIALHEDRAEVAADLPEGAAQMVNMAAVNTLRRYLVTNTK